MRETGGRETIRAVSVGREYPESVVRAVAPPFAHERDAVRGHRVLALVHRLGVSAARVSTIRLLPQWDHVQELVPHELRLELFVS